MNARALAFTFLFSIFLFVIELVRRGRLTFKYAAGWLLVAILGMLAVGFDQFLFKVSTWLGFALPSNFIFFGLMCVFIVWGLLLTVFLCQQDNRNHTMAQKTTLLEFEVEQLKKELKRRPSV